MLINIKDRREAKPLLPSLTEFLDEATFKTRGTFMFRAIHMATAVAEAQIGTADETPALARGLCRTYSTASNMVWYTRTRDYLQRVIKKLGRRSAKGIEEAIAAQQAWLKTGPKKEKDLVLGRYCRDGDVTKRLRELEKIAAGLK